ncbi:hypothetical protein C8F01DRAFT_545310 [Mycena amicta]|nr:hypothetical protein C8F01DRAFT_545310 [Mycena amicta]
MLDRSFCGLKDVDEFLDTYMMPPAPGEDDAVKQMMKTGKLMLAEAQAQYEQRPTDRKDESHMSESLIDYWTALVSQFEAKHTPSFHDTSHTPFPPLDEGDHNIMPDITSNQPGQTDKPKKWEEGGFTAEIKDHLDLFNEDNEFSVDLEHLKALVQLGKNARSLLMASGRCYVFVVTIFDHCMARILCFDRTGFVATHAFNWLDENSRIFPTFLYRLYHPEGHPGRMDGDDFSVSRLPNKNATDRKHRADLYAALCTVPFYADMFRDKESALADSLRFQAVRQQDGERKMVHCITVGPVLSRSDGLFSRATRVYRVIVEEDVANASDEHPLVIYAMKDSWREGSRREEVDFYDMIAYHCKVNNIDMEEKGMAMCHGSVDLFSDPLLHVEVQRSRMIPLAKGEHDSRLLRHHTRTLITPVGVPLKKFPSTRALAVAVRNAILHHKIAHDAGVLHRDVSEGNVLLIEALSKDQPQRGFLVDYDYAEITPTGMTVLQAQFPDRMQLEEKELKKSLKDVTGTRPFMSIEIMEEGGKVKHEDFHDLESFFWLLVWMMLRHIKHNHKYGRNACHLLFDGLDSEEAKTSWITRATPLPEEHRLYELLENYRDQVMLQNPPSPPQRPPTFHKVDLPRGRAAPQHQPPKAIRRTMTHDDLLFIFADFVNEPTGWPDNDKALPFVPPHKADHRGENTILQSLLRSGLPNAASKGSKRKEREDDETTTGPAAKKPTTGSHAQSHQKIHRSGNHKGSRGAGRRV